MADAGEDAAHSSEQGVSTQNLAQNVPSTSLFQFHPVNFPIPSAMKCKGDLVNNWEFFKQQWNDYEIVTGLRQKDAAVRLATLRSVMGRDCLQIFLNLKLSEADKKDTGKCLEALENYFKPKRNVVYERYMFNSSVQESEESINSFLTRLRKLAASCEFGELTDQLIRDRLVVGLRDSVMKARLLRESKLDLVKAVNMCNTSEIASEQLKKMQTTGAAKLEEIKKVEFTKKFRQQKKSTKYNSAQDKQQYATGKCKQCGRNQKHAKKEHCPAFGKKCRACDKMNHFAAVCFSRKKVHQIEGEEDLSSDENCLKVETISLVESKSKQWFANINFLPRGKEKYETQLSCQLDTGSTCNVISANDLSVITQIGEPPLKKSSVKLKLFGGTTMNPLGECNLCVKHKETKHVLKFQVVGYNCKPLLSAETCEKLDLVKVNHSVSDTLNFVSNTASPLSKEDIVKNYTDVFQGLGHIGDVSFTVDESVQPVQHAPRRVPVALQEEVKKKILDLEGKGIIAKTEEPTEWISSMVVVAKPNKIRICLDPKDLNQAVKRPKYQMPTFEELLPKLNKAKYFSTFDAKDGFYQVGLDEKSSKLTTFWTPIGRYRYLRLPFGINLAPEVFECKLQECLADLTGVLVIRDDILVVGYGESDEEALVNHDMNVKNLLERARKVNLKLNKDKMNLRKASVKFMGHVIGREGLKPDSDKVSAIENMAKPSSKKEVLTLLGFVNYLAKFLPRLSEVSQPLRELTADGAEFIWSKQHEKAFESIKELVVKHPVLQYYSVDDEVVLQTDASDKGVGAVLLQKGKPVAFASRTLSQTEQRYATIEKECLAIVFGCERFYQYLAWKDNIFVETDHKPLESIFKKSVLSAPCRLQRMLLRLQRFNLNVNYKPGPQMYLADHLSRAPQTEDVKQEDTFQVFALELETVNPIQTLKLAPERLCQLQMCTGQDSTLQTLKNTVLTGWPETRDMVPVSIRDYWNYRDEITLHNGVLFKAHRVIIPTSMRSETMSKIHSSHQGVEACLRKARDSVFWPHMTAEVKEKVKECEICAEFQIKNSKEPMQSHPIPDRPWSRVAADQFTLYRKDYIVLVDFYSDFIEVKKLNENTSTSVIKFLKEQFSRYGIPDTLVTDNGPQYTSDKFNQFVQSWEFVHVTSSPHHHRANGKVEAAVKIAKSLIKKAHRDNKDPFLALLDYRNTPTEEIGTSPTQRLMSRRARTLLPISTDLLYPKVPGSVKDKLTLRRQRSKLYFDRSARRLPELEEGQDVRIAPLQKHETWQHGSCLKKLSDRSYLVKADDSGQTVRRNREFLKPSENSKETELTVQEDIPIQNTENTVQEPVPDIPQPEADKVAEKRTRTRVVKLPQRFQDYAVG